MNRKSFLSILPKAIISLPFITKLISKPVEYGAAILTFSDGSMTTYCDGLNANSGIVHKPLMKMKVGDKHPFRFQVFRYMKGFDSAVVTISKIEYFNDYEAACETMEAIVKSKNAKKHPFLWRPHQSDSWTPMCSIHNT